jgi:DNA-3-methyladenine glycosylase II
LDAVDAYLHDADPVLGALIDVNGDLGPPLTFEGPYAALVRAIIGQQLSVRAAQAIHGRLLERFGGRVPEPDEILAQDPDALRTAVGLSRAKVVFLRSLAEHLTSGQLDIDRLAELPDEEVLAAVTSVKGVGAWTAQIFLMFQLGRPDVLAVGDLGIRRAVERAYELADLPSSAELEAIAEPWRPYRTRACRHLWQSLRNAPVSSRDG